MRIVNLLHSNHQTAIVVAHPDDELLFGWEYLKSDPNCLIVILTNASNKVRADEVCAIYNSKGLLPRSYVLLDYEDLWKPYKPFSLECSKEVLDLLTEQKVKTIITHNEKGEYGHAQHTACHRMIRTYPSSFIKKQFVAQYRKGRFEPEKITLIRATYPSQYLILARIVAEWNISMDFQEFL